MTDAHGPLARAMLVGFDLIEAARERQSRHGGGALQQPATAGTQYVRLSSAGQLGSVVNLSQAVTDPAGIPGRPPGHCPQVPDPETPPSQLARPRRAGGGGGSTVLAGDAQPADTIPPTAAMPQPVLLAALHAGGSWTVRLKPRKG